MINQGHVQSGEIINLEMLKGDMHVDASYALVKTDDMEVIRMALSANKKISEHHLDGEISVQCLKGHIQFYLEDSVRDLKPEDWMFLEKKQPFSYRVKEDAILLVTILFVDHDD
jgi:quercetin dioxygenase-like cupin family protein